MDNQNPPKASDPAALCSRLREDLQRVALIGPDYDAALATLDELEAALAASVVPPNGGVRETERRHTADCREQEAQSAREAKALQAGFELGQASAASVVPQDWQLPQSLTDRIAFPLEWDGQDLLDATRRIVVWGKEGSDDPRDDVDRSLGRYVAELLNRLYAFGRI